MNSGLLCPLCSIVALITFKEKLGPFILGAVTERNGVAKPWEELRQVERDDDDGRLVVFLADESGPSTVSVKNGEDAASISKFPSSVGK